MTQNVDGLHARAGSTEVVELHGTLHRFFCADQRHPVPGVGDQERVPRCPECGSYVRPAVVWFGEYIPDEAAEGAARAIPRAEAVLLVGTSLAVTTPAGLLRHAHRQGIPIVEVNPDPALPVGGDASGALPPATVVIVGTAGAVLPEVLACGCRVQRLPWPDGLHASSTEMRHICDRGPEEWAGRHGPPRVRFDPLVGRSGGGRGSRRCGGVPAT